LPTLVEKPKEKEKPEVPNEEQEEVQEDDQVKKVRGIPEDVELFVVFWGQIVELVKVKGE
jgi:vacuolar protein sorting-associated protein 35